MHCGVRLHGQNACYVIFWNIAPKHWIYIQNLPVKMCRIEKNPIMISPYPIFEVDKLPHDEIFKILNINYIFIIICLHCQNACYVIFWNIAPKHWIYMDTGYCNSFYFNF
jgi:hypothetical protein